MSTKVRKGNSFEVLYTAILDDNIVVDLRTVENLRVKLCNTWSPNIYGVTPTFEGGRLRVKVPPTIAHGEYRLLVEFMLNGEQFTRDPKCFVIVSNVENETKNPDNECSIEVQTVNVDDVINGLGLPGIDGKSAYQIWLDNGHEGTEEDFLNWLKLDFEDLIPEEVALLQKPATDAAEDVEGRMFEIEQSYEVIQNDASVAIPAAMQAAIDANSAAGNANSAATNANNAALAASNKIAELETYEDRLHELENNWTNNW